MSVVMVGLDAVDAGVVERLAAEGALPNLDRLRGAGLYGRLESPAELYPGGVWPTFYSARDVPSHGAFHNKLWRCGEMSVEVPTDAWIHARPFWEALPERLRVCLVDVPMVLGRPRPVNGVYLGGWGPHDVMGRGSWPDGLWSACVRRHGRPLMPVEHFGRQSVRSLSVLPRRLAAANRQITDIALDLMQREAWDFTCVVLSAGHRAGHYLWDRSQLGDGASPSDEPHPDLIAIYREIDVALGRILECAPEGALVMAFAVHGMGPNAGWADLLTDILARLSEHAPGAPSSRGLMYRLKRRIPFHWVRPLLHALPLRANQELVSLWSRKMFDWSTTRWFPLPMDGPGNIRINLRGREREGIVEPGEEYEAVCREVESLVLGLRDADSGEPLARSVVRAWADAAADAPGRPLLPDLIVPWSGPAAASTRRIVSDAFPDLAYDVPRALPSGRSGNHLGRGWFVACGPGVAAGEAAGRHRVIDLVPTVLRHLGVAPPGEMEGRPIDLGAAR